MPGHRPVTTPLGFFRVTKEAPYGMISCLATWDEGKRVRFSHLSHRTLKSVAEPLAELEREHVDLLETLKASPDDLLALYKLRTAFKTRFADSIV